AVHFLVKINTIKGLPNRFTDVYCKYRLFLDTEDTKTKSVADPSTGRINHSHMYSFAPATKQLVEYLHECSFMIQVWGRQKMRKSAALYAQGKSTKELLHNDREIMVGTSDLLTGGFQMNGRVVDPQRQSIIVELLLLKKQQARQQQKLVKC